MLCLMRSPVQPTSASIRAMIAKMRNCRSPDQPSYKLGLGATARWLVRESDPCGLGTLRLASCQLVSRRRSTAGQASRADG
jgi:hypothetical protein